MFYHASITWCMKMSKLLDKLDPRSIGPRLGHRSIVSEQRRRLAGRLIGTENVENSKSVGLSDNVN